jgi:hypothetical protein
MEPDEIRRLVGALDRTSFLEQEPVWDKLRPLGEDVVPYLAEFYEQARKWQGRITAVYHCIPYGRRNEVAFQLGLAACDDRSVWVRHRACGLLAYSLRKDARASLKVLKKHPDRRTREDASAALKAIKRQNHHLWVDRDNSGQSFWVVSPEDHPWWSDSD